MPKSNRAVNEQPFEPVGIGECAVCHDSELLNANNTCSSCQFCMNNPASSSPWFRQPEDSDSHLDCTEDDDDNEYGGPTSPALV